MSDFNQQKDYAKYVGGIASSEYDTLPTQTIPKSKKNDKWKRLVMDTLENIGLRQIRENRVFADYRKMQQGRLVYADFDESQTDLRGISAFRAEEKLPTFLKHYDLIGRIINLLAGEFNKQKDSINIVSTDIFSTGEFLLEKDSQIRKFTEDYFNKILEIGLIEKGLDPYRKDFESEEERQAYLQQLQQERDAIVPPDVIEKDLRKTFKTSIVEWAENTLESNYIKFNLEMLDTEELIDYLSTGRYFRHYYVGHNYYKPETWDVERTFFSQDLDVLHPQECEYVGTIHLMSGAKVLSKYGHMIPKNIQNKLYGEDFYGSVVDSVGPLSFIESAGSTPTSVPHAGYYQQQTAQAFQNLLGIPWGVRHFGDQDGGLGEGRYSWVNPNRTNNNIGWGKIFRDDINVRIDELQITESYFRSQKLMGLLTIENPVTELPYQVMLEEDLIPDFLEHYNIKKQSTKTWDEVVSSPLDYINTITYGFLPEIWKGFKLNATNTNLKDDYYFGVEPLKYQITGIENEFDVKIPVAGIISSGIGEIIRAYQIDYNIVMNQNRQYLEKTIGTFFMMDWNLLPSQYKNESGETTAELIEEWRETIRELGMGLMDNSPANTKGLNPAQNEIRTYDISYINNIQMNLTMAREIEQKAFDLIGITRERRGNPNEYMTAEGTKQGVEASYAQTEVIYKRFNTAKVREKEIELAVAQYSEANNKDISINYMDSQNERIVRSFVDPNFSLRKLQVFPADDSTKRRELETFKNFILQQNTMDNDIYDLGSVVTSDNFVSLLEFGLNKRKKLEEKETLQHERAKELNQQQIEASQKQIDAANAREDNNKQLDRDSNEYIAEIKTQATLADSNVEPDYLNRFFDEQDRKSKERDIETKNGMKEREIDLKESKQEYDATEDAKQTNLKFLELREKAKDRVERRKQSKDNVTIARVNT